MAYHDTGPVTLFLMPFSGDDPDIPFMPAVDYFSSTPPCSRLRSARNDFADAVDS
jgi:hypothetical protein